MMVNVDARTRGEGVPFCKIRRITGYLVGSLDRFNTGKAAEEHDRVKHDAGKLSLAEAEADQTVNATILKYCDN